jgi:hypothetical protein
MSLTHFIKHPEVRISFDNYFKKPRIQNKGKNTILCNPIGEGSIYASIVGNAFDYLLRFYLENKHINKVKTEKWIAEYALDMYSKETDYSKAKKILKTVKLIHKDIIKNGVIKDEYLPEIIKLAQMDFIYRAGRFNKYQELGIVPNELIIDLKNLRDSIIHNHWECENICLLNPSFGKYSNQLKGADADLIIDTTVIEIKTIKKREFSKETFRQLIGYYTLAKLMNYKVDKIAVYFSRYCNFEYIQMDEIISENDFIKFKNWFKKNIKQYL